MRLFLVLTNLSLDEEETIPFYLFNAETHVRMNDYILEYFQSHSIEDGFHQLMRDYNDNEPFEGTTLMLYPQILSQLNSKE